MTIVANVDDINDTSSSQKLTSKRTIATLINSYDTQQQIINNSVTVTDKYVHQSKQSAKLETAKIISPRTRVDIRPMTTTTDLNKNSNRRFDDRKPTNITTTTAMNKCNRILSTKTQTSIKKLPDPYDTESELNSTDIQKQQVEEAILITKQKNSNNSSSDGLVESKCHQPSTHRFSITKQPLHQRTPTPLKKMMNGGRQGRQQDDENRDEEIEQIEKFDENDICVDEENIGESQQKTTLTNRSPGCRIRASPLTSLTKKINVMYNTPTNLSNNSMFQGNGDRLITCEKQQKLDRTLLRRRQRSKEQQHDASVLGNEQTSITWTIVLYIIATLIILFICHRFLISVWPKRRKTFIEQMCDYLTDFFTN
ncbi:unnamed protein product [Didymodactylos carnosus]|uniref:Uncharacterized protein n=1 Tax=Didymodactylos carnosus TaxID=1234261 RepID=A0A814LUR5_9BILA|nr:unnamed protein product [Didymodactylos carnosus]CAF1070032.1 unnamed protein product [Didymodactylos carnosus]CAF3653036.1 unnamed protein product [Didymodactylos carnosus]CAF3837230.1 unnamed protein product [Didymodactylos carnosus]